MEDKSIICECGHDWAWHDRSDYGFSPEEESWCVNYECECILYKSDNLKHIEALAKERNLI